MFCFCFFIHDVYRLKHSVYQLQPQMLSWSSMWFYMVVCTLQSKRICLKPVMRALNCFLCFCLVLFRCLFWLFCLFVCLFCFCCCCLFFCCFVLFWGCCFWGVFFFFFFFFLGGGGVAFFFFFSFFLMTTVFPIFDYQCWINNNKKN